jgi:hypothetical protein
MSKLTETRPSLLPAEPLRGWLERWRWGCRRRFYAGRCLPRCMYSMLCTPVCGDETNLF